MNTRIKLAFMNAGITQYTAAHHLGVSETRVSRIVTGRIQPSDAEKRALARLLRTTVDALFVDDADE